MIIHVKMLNGDHLVTDTPPFEGVNGIRQQIYRAHPEWSISRMRLFTTDTSTGVIDFATLKDGDVIHLYLTEEVFVQIVTGADHEYFSINVSDTEDFAYQHTRSLFFHYTGSPFSQSEVFYYFTHRRFYERIEDMVRANTEYPLEWVDQIVEQANEKWATIQQMYPKARQQYLDRFEMVQSTGW